MTEFTFVYGLVQPMPCSWNEHLAIDIPPGDGATTRRVLTAELWLQQRSGQHSPGIPGETNRTEHDQDVFLGRTEINVGRILVDGSTASSHDGWFKLSGDAGSLHVMLQFAAASSRVKNKGISTGTITLSGGDEAEIDGDLDFLPVNAVMLRLYWDRLWIKRAWKGWSSYLITRKRLQGYITKSQDFAHTTRMCLKNAFEEWASNSKHSAKLVKDRAASRLETQGAEEQAREHEHASHQQRSSGGRRRRSSGYGYGYGTQQKLLSTRVSLEREERAEEDRARRWCVSLPAYLGVTLLVTRTHPALL